MKHNSPCSNCGQRGGERKRGAAQEDKERRGKVQEGERKQGKAKKGTERSRGGRKRCKWTEESKGSQIKG